jgi:isocitrate dehydrogenase
MFEHLGWGDVATAIIAAMEKAISAKTVTYDLERQMEGATLVSCSGFGDAIISHL